ncbi:hypothetical protein [Cesiribacter sp. SM1]|uniref:hypothetical protein n=1 Tax=Cesiribacter sp. SM1 TaxID=2861196 RepID=UPI001CD4FE06|nr:hypothetical protein [Cesiribacter sp. SM1]
MEAVDHKSLKNSLLDACIEKQQQMVQTAREAMISIQESALAERSNEEMTDSFTAQCQNEQSMYARRMHEATGVLTILERVKGVRKGTGVGFGSLVITDKMNFFVAASLGDFELDGQKYFIISTQTPIYEAMEGKEPGQSFSFRGRNYKIQEVMY